MTVADAKPEKNVFPLEHSEEHSVVPRHAMAQPACMQGGLLTTLPKRSNYAEKSSVYRQKTDMLFVQWAILRNLKIIDQKNPKILGLGFQLRQI